MSGDTEQLGHSSAGRQYPTEYTSQKMNTDLRELLLCSGISIASMFTMFECFLTNPSHPQEEHGVLVSTFKALHFF